MRRGPPAEGGFYRGSGKSRPGGRAEVGKAIQIGQGRLRHISQKAYRGRITREFQGALFEAASIVAITCHQMDEAREFGAQCWKDSERLLVALIALAGRQTAYRQEDRT